MYRGYITNPGLLSAFWPLGMARKNRLLQHLHAPVELWLTSQTS